LNFKQKAFHFFHPKKPKRKFYNKFKAKRELKSKYGLKKSAKNGIKLKKNIKTSYKKLRPSVLKMATTFTSTSMDNFTKFMNRKSFLKSKRHLIQKFKPNLVNMKKITKTYNNRG